MSRKIIGVTVGTPLSAAKIEEKLKPVKTINGEAPDENGNVKLPDYAEKSDVPKALSDMTEDTSHRTVTDAEKQAWNAKSDFSGKYADLQGKPSIPSAYTHPEEHPASMISGLATVATSGKYADLSGRPTIPTVPSALKNPNALTFTGAASGSYDGSEAKTVNIPTVPSALKNPKALTIDGQSYDGSSAVTVYTGSGKSVKAYGAKGDGSTNDTAAFQAALAAERVVYVPGGTYKLSGGLVIGANCMLELAQDVVLNFTQTSGNCISMLRLANLKGNHATIFVPYTFGGNVINCDTGDDEAAFGSGDKNTENALAVPPFKKWDPQWKMSRYVTDINICKPNEVAGKPYDSNFHYSNDGTCYGTAVYLHCNAEDFTSYMWGVSMSGIRIAGGFNYGIHIQNLGDHVESWNHDLRIEAVIDACKIGVLSENSRYAHLNVSVQGRPALDGTKYAEHGFKLVDSRGFDLSGCSVWDWNAQKTKWTSGGVYQHIALYGECRGLILGDFKYYEDGADIRSLIYTDTASNLEQMTILQEPFTRWFKPVDGDPYFFDGIKNKKLATDEEVDTKIDAHFITDVVPTFTNVLATAIDTDGTIYNGIGYKKNTYADPTLPPTISSHNYACLTGLIPCKPGDTLHAVDLSFTNTSYARMLFYDANKNPIAAGSYTAQVAAATIVANSGSGTSQFTKNYTATENGFKVTIGSAATIARTAYVRICFNIADVGTKPMIAVNEEIKYTTEGFLADGIKIKAENVVGLSNGGGTGGGGGSIDVAATVGQTIRVKEVDASGKPTKWEAVDYQPKICDVTETVLLPETTAECFDMEGIMVAELPEGVRIKQGVEYAVMYNGVKYTTKGFVTQADEYAEVSGFGNGAAFGVPGGDTNSPFVLMTDAFYNSDDGVWELASLFAPLDGSTSVTVSVTEVNRTPIPVQYMTNALPYYVEVTGEEVDNIITYSTNETVENVMAIFNSGRPIKLRHTEYNGSAIMSLEYNFYMHITTADQQALGFVAFSPMNTNAAGAYLRLWLITQDDGTWLVTSETIGD